MRRNTIVSLLLVALLVLSGCGQAAAPGGASSGKALPKAADGTLLRKIQDRGKIIVGVKYDVPLFGLLDPTTNQPQGFDVDISKAVAERIFGDPSKIEFKEAVSKNRVPFLNDGTVDMIASTMTINDERVQQVDFSEPYYVAGQSLLVPKGSAIKSIKDLAGKNVGTAKGSTSEKNLTEKAPQAKPALFDGYAEAVAAMQAGRVDAVTTDDIILYGYVSKQPDKLEVVGGQFTVEPYGIVIQKGHSELLDVVNTTVRDMKSNGKWAEIYKKWIPGGNTPAVPPANWKDVKLP